MLREMVVCSNFTVYKFSDKKNINLTKHSAKINASSPNTVHD